MSNSRARQSLAAALFVVFSICVAARSGEVVSTMRNVNAVPEAHGFRINPAFDMVGVRGPDEMGEPQAFEILRPLDQGVTLGRIYTSCTCIQLVAPKRTFAPGERAVLHLRNVKETPTNGQIYAIYVQISNPVRTTLRFDTFVQSNNLINPEVAGEDGEDGEAAEAAEAEVDEKDAAATAAATAAEAEAVAAAAAAAPPALTAEELPEMPGIEIIVPGTAAQAAAASAAVAEEAAEDSVAEAAGVAEAEIASAASAAEVAAAEAALAAAREELAAIMSTRSEELTAAAPSVREEIDSFFSPGRGTAAEGAGWQVVAAAPADPAPAPAAPAGTPAAPVARPAARAASPAAPASAAQPVRAVSLITLAVRDISRSAAFYEGIGWQRAARSKYDAAAFFQLHGQVLALYPQADMLREQGMPDARPAPGGITLALHVATPEEVEIEFERFVAAGGVPLREPSAQPGGAVTGYVADPDGNPWEISCVPQFVLDGEGGLWLR